MAEELRSCSRAGCRWPAAASLSYRYSTKQVWLLDLSPQRDPNLWDLCPHHADATTVPRGWDRVDERTAYAVIREPAGRDLVGAGTSDLAPGPAGESRYAALSRDLPRLAAELAVGDPGRSRLAPVPSRELSPSMPADPPPPAAREAEPEDGGQLAIPVAEAVEPEEAVVVSIELAGARRRPVDATG